VIVRTLDQTIGSAKDVHGHGWRSRRLLTKADAMGFSFHDTVLSEGSEQELEYRHHLEANYCISGEGEVVDVASGKVYPIRPGTLYALDKNDRHILRVTKGDLRLICVFYPALIGTEVHQSDGSYAAPDVETKT
jgi:L-ectoine synthase